MTRSLGASPDRITRKPPRISPISTRFGATVPSAETVITMCCDWSGSTALSGTRTVGEGGATAGNQIGYRTEMRAHAPCERRRNLAMVEVEPCITDSGFGRLDRSARRPLIGCALVYVFHASSVALLQILGTVKLPVSQFQMSRRNIDLGSRLGECDLVGARVNGEQEVTLPHDVAVLEKYSSERAAYLRAQLHLRDGRKLTKEAQLCIKVLDHRLAHHDLRKGSWPGIGRGSTRTGRIFEPRTHKGYPC